MTLGSRSFRFISEQSLRDRLEMPPFLSFSAHCYDSFIYLLTFYLPIHLLRMTVGFFVSIDNIINAELRNLFLERVTKVEVLLLCILFHNRQ